MTTAAQLHAQAAQAYHTACSLARAGKRDPADKAFADTYRLVAAAHAAHDQADTDKKGAAA
jgi:hypothetical protein